MADRLHVGSLLLVVVIAIAGGCEKSPAAKPGQPSEPAARETGPARALERLRAAVAAGGDLGGLRDAMVELRIAGRSSIDMAIESIRADDKRGDFAYSDAAIAKILASHQGDFRVPDAALFDKIKRNILDEEGKRLATKAATDFLVFEIEKSRMLLVRDGDRYLIVFWEGLPALVGDPDSDDTKDLAR